MVSTTFSRSMRNIACDENSCNTIIGKPATDLTSQRELRLTGVEIHVTEDTSTTYDAENHLATFTDFDNRVALVGANSQQAI